MIPGSLKHRLRIDSVSSPREPIDLLNPECTDHRHSIVSSWNNGSSPLWSLKFQSSGHHHTTIVWKIDHRTSHRDLAPSYVLGFDKPKGNHSIKATESIEGVLNATKTKLNHYACIIARFSETFIWSSNWANKDQIGSLWRDCVTGISVCLLHSFSTLRVTISHSSNDSYLHIFGTTKDIVPKRSNTSIYSWAILYHTDPWNQQEFLA